MKEYLLDFIISMGSHPLLYFYILGCICALICICIVSRDELKEPDAQWGMIPTVVLLSWLTVGTCIYYKIKDD